MRILFIGDTVGKAGRAIVHQHLKDLRQKYLVDLTILNCENAAAGFGVTPKLADEFFDWGIDLLTSGITFGIRKKSWNISTTIPEF